MKKKASFIIFLIFIPFFAIKAQIVSPLQHEMKYFIQASGKQFAPCSLPVYLNISSQPNAKGLLTQVKKNKDNPPMFLSEGKNRICNNMAVTSANGVRKVQQCYNIYGDRTPPKSTIGFVNAQKYKSKIGIYFGKDLKIKIDALDKLSGTDKSYISINNSQFEDFSTFTFNLTDGSYKLLFYSVDNVGNVEKAKEKNIFVDLSAPITKMQFVGVVKSNILPSETSISLLASDNLSGVKNIFYKIDNQKEKIYRKPISIKGLELGVHKLRYYALDNVGNLEKEIIWEFIKDIEPPKIETIVDGDIFEENNILFSAGMPKVTFVVTDSVAGVKNIRYDINNTETKEYSGTFTLPNDAGLQRINYYATDLVDNRSKSYIKNIYIDVNPPKTYYQTTKTSFWSNDTLIITKNTGIAFTATDIEAAVAETHIILSGKDINVGSDTLYVPDIGDYKVIYYSVDNVGNKEDKNEILIRVKEAISENVVAENPENKVWLLNNEKLIGATHLPFFIRISDSPDENSNSYLLENEKGTLNNTAFLFSKQGLNNLVLKIAGQEKRYKIRIDGTPPKTTAIFSNTKKSVTKKNTYFSAGLVLSFNSEENVKGISSGLYNVYFSVNGSKYEIYQKPISVFSREQKYTLKYYATDSVENKEETQVDSFFVDVTPPVSVAKFVKANYGNVVSSKSEIKLQVTDNLSGVWQTYFYFDNLTQQKYLGNIYGNQFRKLPEGKHSLTFYSVDFVGNIEKKQTIPIIIDHTAPLLYLKVLGQQYEKKQTLFISKNSQLLLSATETATELQKIKYRILGGKMLNYTSFVKFPKQNGQFTLNYSVSDRVENATKKSKRIYVDNIPPVSSVSITGNIFVNLGNKIVSSSTKIELSAKDNAAGIKNIFYNIGTGNKKYSKTISLKGNGKRTIRFFAQDNVGNREKTQKQIVLVDNQPPEIKVVITPKPEIDNKGVFHITPYSSVHVKGADAVAGISGIFFAQDKGTKQVYRKPISDFSKGKSIQITVFATDKVGNTATKTIFLKVK